MNRSWLPSRYKQLKKVLKRITLVIVLIVILGGVNLSWLVERQLISQLKQLGAETASIQQLNIAWWRGKVEVEHLRFHVKHHAPFYVTTPRPSPNGYGRGFLFQRP